jgi:hypothetical protein
MKNVTNLLWTKLILVMLGLVLSADVTAGSNIPKGTCQWEMDGKFAADFGCVGKIGLMRISREQMFGMPLQIKKASQILFGTPELPAIGSEITIMRSAHLRGRYWMERDEQTLEKWDKICTGIDCGRSPERRCTAMPSRTITPKTCPSPTIETEYFAAGTVVKILGYQQMGQLFVLVQIVKVESNDPMEDEKKYQFDRNEVI